MKAVKQVFRAVALLGLFSAGLGLHELWADGAPRSEPGTSSVFEMRTEPNKSEMKQQPPVECVVKKYETICVRTNDRIEMDRFIDQNRKVDTAKVDMYQQVVR